MHGRVKVYNQWFTTDEAAEYLRMTRGGLAKMRHYGRGPKYTKASKNVLYKLSDLDAWLEARAVVPGDGE